MPSVTTWYEFLKQSSMDPLAIGLPEFEMEVVIFALHCLDRVVLAHWGGEYRAALMDNAFAFVYER